MERDDCLERVEVEPIPDLSGIDGALLAMGAKRDGQPGHVMLTTAAVAALIIGVLGGSPAPGA